MEFIFEFLLELIITPITEIYAFAMSQFAVNNKKIDKTKIQIVVIIECIILFILFAVGAVMLLETSGGSLDGKILIIASVGISVLQIIIANLVKKSNNYR